MIVEMSGTPASGKSSIITSLIHQQLCEPIQSNYFQNLETGKFQIEIIWSILETLSRIKEMAEINNSNSMKLRIIERGIFDRIAWARLLAVKDTKYTQVANDLEETLKKTLSSTKIDIIFLFLTSYDKVRNRRKSKYEQYPKRRFNVINPDTIQFLNNTYQNLYNEIQGEKHIVKIDDLNQDLSLKDKISIVNYTINNLH